MTRKWSLITRRKKVMELSRMMPKLKVPQIGMYSSNGFIAKCLGGKLSRIFKACARS